MSFIKRLKSALSKNKQTHVYLGDLAVVPRSSFIKLVEMGWETKDTDIQLRSWISELVDIPLASEIEYDSENTLILDILVTNYKCGTDAFLWSDPMLPFAWRPSVKLHGRLFRASDHKVTGTFSIKKTIGWGKYFSRVFGFRSWFSLSGPFKEEDMKYLLGCGLVDLIKWASKNSK